jgi:glycosyltransferase involved in cell wall biosynthesis
LFFEKKTWIHYTQTTAFRQIFFIFTLWYIAFMRILFIADGRSPTALSWMHYWIEAGHEAHLISSYPCEPPQGMSSFEILPLAFGGMAGMNSIAGSRSSPLSGILGRFRSPLRYLRNILGPLSLVPQQVHFRSQVEKIQPDLVHALRIPFEGMLAAVTPPNIPLVISIWGNDLTLHARASFQMRHLTHQTLNRANGLIADTFRDIRLGKDWGFATNNLTLVVPGGGGIRLDEINSSSFSERLPEELPDVPIIVNPRGQRPGSLRQDIFFQSIPLVLKEIPQAIFVCPPLAGDKESEHWVDLLRIRNNTRLWPLLNRSQIWALLRKARVFVSPSIHDGTPNSFLEAMACGCFPVVGNLESFREWIKPGDNGLLVDAKSPRSVAEGIVFALKNPALCERAKKENAQIIAERADYGRCMAMTEAFFEELSSGKKRDSSG